MVVDYDVVKKRKFFGQVNFEYERAGAEEEGRELSEDTWRSDVEDRVKSLCSDSQDRYYLIFHDKDTWEDKGELVAKPLHAHFVFDFKNARSWTNVQKIMKISRAENLSHSVRSLAKVCRYLTHRTEAAISEGKWQYEINEVITNGDYREVIVGGSVRSLSNNERSSDGLMIDEFCLDLGYRVQEKGLLPIDAKAELYEEFPELNAQKAWDKNRRIFEQNRQEFIETEFKRLKNGGRNHIAFYIHGLGESGKSQFAKVMGELHDPKLGSHNPSVNDKRLDLGSHYAGHRTMILDEFDAGSKMGYRELFKLLEPNNVSQLSSRFKDVLLINDLTIFTHSLDYLDWVDGWIVNDKKQYESLLHQFFRRIKYVVSIESKQKVLKNGRKERFGKVKLFRYEGDANKGLANKEELKLVKSFRVRKHAEDDDSEIFRIVGEVMKIAKISFDLDLLETKTKQKKTKTKKSKSKK